MQAHSTIRGKRPKIIDVDLLSDVSSPKCHSPKSPRIKEEELDDIARDYLESTWGKEKCKYWATCYHWECFTAGIQGSQRGENTNRWVKALCTKVRKRCSVNKIFDAVERLVKCQMRTQNRCLAIDDLKKTVTTVNKALPTVIPLVQASLTSYGLQRFLVQVDMGTTMYDVSSYNPQTVEPIPPR